MKRCKDCVPGSSRSASYPGPRCATHHHEVRKARSKAAHERRVIRTYRGVGPGDYDRIWNFQQRRCPICGRRLLSATKRPSLEHDHELDWPFGITCGPCNAFLGYIGRNPEVGERLVHYLRHPPAWQVLGPPPELKEDST